ncbi:MAG: hypothetical protein OEZ24_06465 [Candidatus Bathyarchaeota archaeon]|nr:hypothetical protein [Candidatus Bathyarchaeota archaeon]
MIEMEEKVQIPDNFILKYRSLPPNNDTKEEESKEKKAKDCFGSYSSCANPSECQIRMRCLKEKIEQTRKDILGERLSLKFKAGLFDLASSSLPWQSSKHQRM